MEELKLLIDMVAHLPQMALWVLIGFLAYKLAVVGSIYGVIRLLIVKAHDWLTAERRVQLRIGARSIDQQTADALQEQVARLGNTAYVHMSDVNKLREALDIALKK